MQINAYTISLFVASLVSAGLSYYAWKRRSVAGGAELAALMLAVALWALFQCFEGLATTRSIKMFWSATSYFGSQATPVLLLIFALRYTQRDEWINWKRTALLFVVPFVSIVMAYTSGFQNALWTKVTLTTTWAGTTAIYSHGPWYWVEVVYSYSLVLIAIVLLVRAVFKMPGVYSWQARLLIIATLIPLAAHIIYSFSPNSFQGLEFTPIVFTLTGLLLALALFRFRLLDLRPVASDVLYESIGDAMVALDLENRVVDINPVAQKLIGKPADAAIGKTARVAFEAIPTLAERVMDVTSDASGEADIDLDGTRRHFDITAWPLKDRKGRMLGRLVTLHDVTEIREAQEELKRINADLDVYAHTVSHDLKGPLAALQLASDSLTKLLGMPETEQRNANVSKLADIVVRNTSKSAALVNSLLALAEAGQRPVDVHDVRIADVVKRVIEERHNQIVEKGVRIEYSGLGTVRADSTHMYQLFANLIGNSIQHNTSENPVVRIRLLESSEGTHKYSVCDNGQGIPQKDLEAVFDPFYKRGGHGAGIGLAIVARVVEEYGGEIVAHNDDGACFEFTLRDYQP